MGVSNRLISNAHCADAAPALKNSPDREIAGGKDGRPDFRSPLRLALADDSSEQQHHRRGTRQHHGDHHDEPHQEDRKRAGGGPGSRRSRGDPAWLMAVISNAFMPMPTPASV
jgi:hypothetical protein